MRAAISTLLLCAAMSMQNSSTPARAQNPSQAAGDTSKLTAAPWEFSNADRDKVCTVVFKPDRSAVGQKLEFDKDCAGLFPIVKDIEGWKYSDNDLLRLFDARGKALIEFSEVESGTFEAPTPGIGLLFLQVPGTASPAPRSPDELMGDWTLAVGSRVCTVTFANAPARDGFAVRLKSDCDPAIARSGFASWKLDSGELVIALARGNPWRFEENNVTSWRRVPEGSEAVTLARP